MEWNGFLRIRKVMEEGLRTWVSKHKLSSIGTLWLSAVGASVAYSTRHKLFKPSLRLIHARMHAQALTLAVLSGAAAYHYYEDNHHHHSDSSAPPEVQQQP